MSYIITSYYTLDTPYQEVAHQYLMPSVEKLGIKSDIRGVQNLGSWSRNTSYKPTFILEMMNVHPDKNVVFIDSDAEILEEPSLFGLIPNSYNFAAHMLDRSKWYNREAGMGFELLSGTLFVRNNDRSRYLVNEWKKRCEISSLWEQRILQFLLADSNEEVYNLPVEYTWIATLPDGREPHVKPNNKMIVKHHQVSRTLRSKVHR